MTLLKRKDLLPALIKIKKEHQYLPPEELDKLCKESEITPAQIQSVATFYKHFSFEPAARHAIRVCVGTACHIKGAEFLYQAFRQHLKIKEGKSYDQDRLFSVNKVACLGCCMMAPAVQIDQKIYGWVEPAMVEDVLTDFLASEKVKTSTLKKREAASTTGEVKICLCSSCRAAGADKVYHAMVEDAERFNIPLRPLEVGCSGMSFQSPLMQITTPESEIFSYGKVNEEVALSLLLRHFKPKNIVTWLDALLTPQFNPAKGHIIKDSTPENRAWLSDKTRIATKNSGAIPPNDLASYRQLGGISALQKVLTLSSTEVITQIMQSDLKGRGGGGFPSGQKWEMVREAKENPKYVICNGDEGDPGAFMDRLLLESHPFRILEGMIIAAFTVSAHQGFIYVREEYPLAVERIKEAVEIFKQNGLLGNNILGSDFALNLEVVEGAGAFVCGEETALIASLEGKRGVPSLRPPYPATSGYDGKPTLINNVETLACVPWIILNGAEAFREFGNQESGGTKTFALAGKIKKGGLIEVPMGTTLRSIVYDIGGGVEKGKKLKAILIGGPSGGCIPESQLDLPVDFVNLKKAGAMMGSGGLVVLDEDDCMVDIARYFLEFTANESCGKCTSCRIGTQRMLEILQKFCTGKAKKKDLTQLEELSNLVIEGSLCGLGKTAPNPVLSSLQHFRSEYESHLNKQCPAGKCPELFSFIISDKCTGCTLCAQNCGEQAISYTPWQQHEIIDNKCTRCGVCRQVCPEKAVQVKI